MIAEGAQSIERMSSSRELDRTVKVAKWDQPAFEQIFLAHISRVVGVICRLVGDGARAEELANEVFLKLYHQPVQPEPQGNVAGWLYRTATNLGIDELRSRAKRRHYEEAAGRMATTPDAPADPLSDVLREEKRRRVRSVLAKLKPAQAQILILRHSGFSYDELAESIGVKRGSVGTMLIRAEAVFRKRYKALEK